ncbi:MAG TPA: BolA/IbaG family iron-sulfur metabolism protein [Legionella sp.]|nr:BolA/IbaG family iron-sulfur metabolism protein [Legionella sp.]
MLRKERIEKQLNQELSPHYLSVEDESKNHHVPEGAQTHFKIVAVSTRFNNMTRINRHRMINSLLAEEFHNGLHALSMHLYTESEWEIKEDASVLKSPACRDGYKNK